MEFDAARAYADMEALSFPRRSGGPGAERAAAWVQERLRAAGLDPVVEPFRFSPRLVRTATPALAALIAAAILAAAFVYPASRLGCPGILALGIAIALPATRWTSAAERLLAWRPGATARNIVAPLPARPPVCRAAPDSPAGPCPMPGATKVQIGACLD